MLILLVGIEIAQTGFTTLVTLVLFLGGVQLIAIGLLGEYLARIYDEVKQRPLYIIKDIHGVSAEKSKRAPEPSSSPESDHAKEQH